MRASSRFEDALRDFAGAVKEKTAQVASGEPEDQLRAPFEGLLGAAAATLGTEVVCTGETPLPDRLGRPDYAVHRSGLLAGYVELKAPGRGAAADRFRGRDRSQFQRFSALPNLLYTDGSEWALYRNGQRGDRLVRLAGNIAADGSAAIGPGDAERLATLLTRFLAWEPALPQDRAGRIDLEAFAAVLAPLCRMLRHDTRDALKRRQASVASLARDWRQLLFPDATDAEFADAYAQTVTFALLLGRSEGADPLTLQSAQNALAVQHNPLSRALQVLTDPAALEAVDTAVEALLRVVGAVPAAALTGSGEPWLNFYEDFLAAYDPKLRKDAGVYYTPVEVVRAQTRLVEDLLVRGLGKALGYADPDVVTLDPAAGTGTYLLAVIEQAMARVEQEYGAGSRPPHATDLAGRLYGFELMAGAYAVSELRVSRALSDHGATPPKQGSQVFLADTLESPSAEPLQLPLFLQPIADQRARALQVKSDVPVLVCLGNPPYDRHGAAANGDRARTGGWIRWGDDGDGRDAPLEAFLEPARAAGQSVHIKNLYNLYVYFWRWALWKVFEDETARGPGIVSFVTASSYLDGNAFCGMREHMRRVCDEIWILDLGGEGRGSHQTENVFAIRTPVAIAVAFRAARPERSRPATVRYARLDGTRAQKLARLSKVADFEAVDWRECPEGWHAPFRPVGEGAYFGWPLLADLMPWQHSGVQCKRTWPIAPDRATLERRWRQLLFAEDRARAFRETEDRKVERAYNIALTGQTDPKPIAELRTYARCPEVRRYAWRSFDRRWILADGRLISRPRPDLWRAHGDRQLYFTSLLTQPLGSGPAVQVSAAIPDLHFFSGRGAKDVIPLYRSADASDANIQPGLLDLLGKEYGRPVSPEDFGAYVYGLVGQPAFTERFSAQLESRQLRVPLTRERVLFERVQAAGLRLLWLHTWAERFVPAGESLNRVPPGPAKCTKGIPIDPEGYPRSFQFDPETGILHVGAGEFAPVRREVYEYEISGLRVLPAWLKARMKGGSGRKSSPLDEIGPEVWTAQFTTELLQLIWVLEYTLDGYPAQQELLEAVIESDCFRASDLPAVPDERRAPPRAKSPRAPSLGLGSEDGA